MHKRPYPTWADVLRLSAADACITAYQLGDAAAELALEAIVSGAIAGSVRGLGKREVYAITQQIVDVVAEWIADENVDNAAKTKGKQK